MFHKVGRLWFPEYSHIVGGGNNNNNEKDYAGGETLCGLITDQP